MIVKAHAWELAREIDYEVPDEIVVTFVNWLLRTNAWRTVDGVALDKLYRLRKKLEESKKPHVVLEVVGAPIGQPRK